MQYAIVIERPPASGNYSAYLPDLPGCVAAAETLGELKQLMREAIELHLEGMREDGLPIPLPSRPGGSCGVKKPMSKCFFR